MDYGSSHVFMYANSDEEVISDTEYDEGMWLSDSDEDSPAPVKLTEKPPADPAVLLGSASKYRHLPQLGSGSSGDKEGDVTVKAAGEAAGEAAEGAGPDKEEKQYVELNLAEASSSASPRKPGEGGVGRKTNYVEIDHSKLPPPPPPAPPRPPPPLITPQIALQQASVSAPPRPPPLPKRGIIKNRLGPELSKMRRQRVKWQQQEVPETHVLGGIRQRKARRADTNILAVKFNTLTGPSAVHTGDAVVCSNPSCTAILSHYSQLTEVAGSEGSEGSKEWMCEFCGTSTEVDIMEEEKPSKSDTTFLVTPAAAVEGGGAVGGALGVDDAMVIFCIDISGSMCVTTEVPGKFELKGDDRVRSLGSLNVDRRHQFLPGQRRDVTYVSRLQAVQAAVDHQIHSLTSSHPHQRVALISFSDEVTVLGDGRGEVVTVAGDKLFDSDNLVKSGTEAPLPLPVKDTHSSLSSKVFELEEGGQTALGPALLLAVTMASRAPGSKVIICTDGLANKGVGTLDDLVTDEEQAKVQTFYEDLGTLAQEKNVTVSLVSIKGTDCRIMELGQVADRTGGQVTIVDPLNITKEFSTILANPVIATDVTTKIILHRDLYFRTEESKESVLVIPVGSVTAQTELTYEYGVRRKGKKVVAGKKEGAEGASSGGASSGGASSGGASSGGASSVGASGGEPGQVAPPMVEGKPHLPFQLQIEYTAQDGSRCMRVITQAKPITTSRNVAEKDIDMSVVGAHVAHTAATLAMGGEYSQARLGALSSQRMLQRTSYASPANRHMYNNLMQDLIPLENRLRDRQKTEVVTRGRAYSDDEEEDEELGHDRRSELMATELARRTTKSEPAYRAFGLMKKKKKVISRRKEVADDLATYCYQMKSSKSTDYTPLGPNDDSSDEEQ